MKKRLIRKLTTQEWCVLAVVSVFGILLRYHLRNDISGDYRVFLKPWYDTIQKSGTQALSEQVGDYNLPYQCMILLMTKLPMDSLYAYKLVSCLFDYLLAGAAAALICELTMSKKAAIAGFCMVILFPQVWIDSAHWAQCDSIYTFWVILAVLLYLQDRENLSFFVLGIALSFKMQAVFAVPFFLTAWFLWGHPFRKFFWAVPGFYLFCIPALTAGRKPLDPLAIYLNQTTEYSAIRFNFPSFWGILFPAGGHSEWNGAAILVTILALILGVWWMAFAFQKNVQKNGKVICQVKDKNSGVLLRLCIWSIWTCVLFLPNMHERYAYALDILMIVLFFSTKNIREVPVIALCWMSSLACYGTARLELPLSTDLFRLICCLYTAAYAGFCRKTMQRLRKEEC